MPFAKIKVEAARKKSTYVAEQILESINGGEYEVGEKLPSERKIAQEMGVSRIPVREALSALQIAGVVESVTGDGTYVQRSARLAGTRSLALMILEKNESPFEALRARKILETGIISCIIDKAAFSSLPAIEEALQSMERAVEGINLDGYFEANREFHLALARTLENPIIASVMGYLLSIMDQPLWMEAVQKYFADYEHVKECLVRHRRILNAIQNKDKGLAEKAIKEHFDDTVAEVKTYL